MAPDTQTELLHVNVKLVGSIIAIMVVAVSVVAWGAKLEYDNNMNGERLQQLTFEISAVKSDRQRDNDRITRAESSLTFILEGISEIKQLLKEKAKP